MTTITFPSLRNCIFIQMWLLLVRIGVFSSHSLSIWCSANMSDRWWPLRKKKGWCISDYICLRKQQGQKIQLGLNEQDQPLYWSFLL
ncbi:uncharacterized protein B0P05DRAFT_630130 [Gilbertella persicaria]|uniref:uncharacterized protein n=1 Tax=Gilbertella persicaria TaxID=101096 RepID=UPI00221EB308|nr:uncharacterized protein B0P05DRAFT_630130 [Gilbertella persicaria]KAI8048740.1 hypothetical protein B0P05DRAFT_630130 [Gilbertella persicaria]